MNPFPDFLIIGAMKAATTSLYDLLRRAPGFNLPLEKEPRILRSGRDIGEIKQQYASHFGHGAGLRGEGSTYYTMQPLFEDVSELAMEAIGPGLKLIMVVRNPLDRIVSHLRHDFLVGRLYDDNFDNAIWSDPRYIAFSDYARQLTPWIAQFGRRQVLLLDFYDLVNFPSNEIVKTCKFLGADLDISIADATHSNSPDTLRIPPGTGVLGRFTRSRFYRRTIRPYIPHALHNQIRNKLLGKRQTPNVALSEDTLSRLLPILEEQQARLSSLVAGSR